VNLNWYDYTVKPRYKGGLLSMKQPTSLFSMP